MNNKISFFDRYLTVWVLLCMAIGTIIGKVFPSLVDFLANFEFYNVNVIIAVLIWIMIIPMLVKVEFTSLKKINQKPAGLYVTWIVNWLIKPFTMFAFAVLFFEWIYQLPNASEYVAGAILLGAAPCTAMVFVWSKLVAGDENYTLVQVASNDLIILILFVPIVSFLLGVNTVTIPYQTLFLSIFLFVVMPLVIAILLRKQVVKQKSISYLNEVIIPKFNYLSTPSLLLTLIVIFIFQGNVILNDPLLIILIAIPLIIQTIIIFLIGYYSAKKIKLPHNIAGVCGLIGSSNFFELAVAVSIMLFGLDSPATLVTVVGVLVEVPIMLKLVKFVNNDQY